MVSLIILSGLPGTGKSHFAREIWQRKDIRIVESDVVRKLMVPKPTYSKAENTALFYRCHGYIREYLASGDSVIFDATNLREVYRKPVYEIADDLGAKLIVVQMWAPYEVALTRLLERSTGKGSESDNSSADGVVYKRMMSSQEAISVPHLTVDSSQDITPMVDYILEEMK